LQVLSSLRLIVWNRSVNRKSRIRFYPQRRIRRGNHGVSFAGYRTKNRWNAPSIPRRNGRINHLESVVFRTCV